MGPFTAILGLAAAAAGGYALGRRGVDLQALWGRRGETPSEDGRRLSWRDETEYGRRLAEEQASRHRIAEEIKQHPLTERERRQDEAEDGPRLPSPQQRPAGEMTHPPSF